MSQATIRTDIYNAVAAVTDVGKVYDRMRWFDDWGAYLSLFKTTINSVPQIRGWSIHYAGIPQAAYTHFGDGEQVTHRFIIRGFMRVDDSAESEKTAAALAESVRNALEDNATLQQATDTRYHSDPVTMPIFEERVFGDVLCHYAEIVINVTENR